MSDDGYYANSPYEDLEDIFYDDNASEDLADDLAEHTLPSPIYQDDPAFELLEYYSDWEYYSDDYYDDDPEILKQNPQDGSPAGQGAQGNKGATSKSGKKRKLADTEDIPALDLDERPHLARTVRGTVWAGPRAKSPTPYKDGQADRIALLKNWKEVFQQSSPRATLNRDESWAADLSLEDMGLRKVESAPGREAGTRGPDLAMEEEEEDDEMEVLGQDTVDAPNRSSLANGDRHADMDFEEPKSCKRQHAAPLSSPPASHSSASASTETITEGMKNTGMSVTSSPLGKGKKGRPGKGSGASIVRMQEVSMNGTGPLLGSRKRKASQGADEPVEAAARRSTASSSAKRVASSKLASKKNDVDEEPLIPTTRSTRTRKK